MFAVFTAICSTLVSREKGIGSTVASEFALRSAGTLLSQVLAPLPVPWPGGGPKSLRSPCYPLGKELLIPSTPDPLGKELLIPSTPDPPGKELLIPSTPYPPGDIFNSPIWCFQTFGSSLAIDGEFPQKVVD
ncbi:hypothetical protein PoB_006291200 [Plakobranchus ocellatus]|uniref:Uncharacterized protein n=1 Tax=Plakobranchus ocellatus TaxID=259542 RepID=A0AAV4CWW2_9GAST|nr:hypothetical protein PoB_006291200 [Plakobranchus ocellatus]